MKTIDQKTFRKSVQGLLAAAMVTALPAIAGAAWGTSSSSTTRAIPTSTSCSASTMRASSSAISATARWFPTTATCCCLAITTRWRISPICRPATVPLRPRRSGSATANESPKIVGFYMDANSGVTHGFLDTKGVQVAVDDPHGSPPYVAAPVQNLLGVNDRDEAAGFWVDNNGNEHGFVAQLDESTMKFSFTEVPPSLFKGAVATQVSNINDEHESVRLLDRRQQDQPRFRGSLGRALLQLRGRDRRHEGRRARRYSAATTTAGSSDRSPTRPVNCTASSTGRPVPPVRCARILAGARARRSGDADQWHQRLWRHRGLLLRRRLEGEELRPLRRRISDPIIRYDCFIWPQSYDWGFFLDQSTRPGW